MNQRFTRIVLLGLSMLAAPAVLAQEPETPDPDAPKKIYKHQQPDGSVIYTDEPAPGAEEIRVQQVPTYEPPKTPRFTPYQSQPETQAQGRGYERFAITAPDNDQAIRENTGNVTISVSISPALDSRHQIEYSLDGQQVATTDQTSQLLENVARGTHTVSAKVVDARGKVLAESSVVFHLQRTSKLQPGRNAIFPGPLKKP